MARKTESRESRCQLEFKGKKRLRGVPVYYDQKKQRVNLTLTPLALERLEARAVEQGLSWSEVIERWLRGNLESSA